jgi:hypothetical protein
MGRTLALSFAAAAALVTAGCAEDVALEDTGTACLALEPGGWPTGGLSFEVGEPLYVTVRLHECLSSSCDVSPWAECEVSVAGGTITITASGGYTDEGGAAAACTSDCVILETSCQTAGPMPAGDYTVRYGDAEIPLAIPSLTGNYCVPMRTP